VRYDFLVGGEAVAWDPEENKILPFQVDASECYKLLARCHVYILLAQQRLLVG
jgi:hypothetical protein